MAAIPTSDSSNSAMATYISWLCSGNQITTIVTTLPPWYNTFFFLITILLFYILKIFLNFKFLQNTLENFTTNSQLFFFFPEYNTHQTNTLVLLFV